MLSVVSIVIATLSLFVSFYVAHRAWKYNELSTRRASRETHVQMLFDIDRLFIEHPGLWSIYDTNAIGKKRAPSDHSAACREAFLYQHFNMFDLVHDYYQNIISTDRIDSAHWESWKTYLRQLLIESAQARALFKEARSQEL